MIFNNFISLYEQFKTACYLFNQRCSCNDYNYKITLFVSLNTLEKDTKKTWTGIISNEELDNKEVFEGTFDNVIIQLSLKMKEHIKNLTMAMLANISEWYDDKPKIKEEIYNLYTLFNEEV